MWQVKEVIKPSFESRQSDKIQQVFRFEKIAEFILVLACLRLVIEYLITFTLVYWAPLVTLWKALVTSKGDNYADSYLVKNCWSPQKGWLSVSLLIQRAGLFLSAGNITQGCQEGRKISDSANRCSFTNVKLLKHKWWFIRMKV